MTETCAAGLPSAPVICVTVTPTGLDADTDDPLAHVFIDDPTFDMRRNCSSAYFVQTVVLSVAVLELEEA